MQNLAGNRNADIVIRVELRAAGIEERDLLAREVGEVPATIGGKLGAFTFRRCWYYWAAEGPMPLDAARRLYVDPVGRKDVRVAGHCGCPPPDGWECDGFVWSYHIDSEEGLCLFANMVRSLPCG